MKAILQYRQDVEDKISSIAFANRNILSYTINFNEDESRLEILLTYNGFTAKMYYSDINQYGYTFLENDNLGKSLVTKFEFPFSDIPYSIYDVHNAVKDRLFDTYDFHCLYSVNDVMNAIDTVISFINRNEIALNSASENEEIKSRLESSFNKGLAIVSKKITREKIATNPEKYLQNHDIDLFYLRFTETAFTEHISEGKTQHLQRFLSKQSRKNMLLPFEERYLEYLYQNDFNITNEATSSRIKKQEKDSSFITKADTITLIISIILGVLIQFFIGLFVENKIEENYILLKNSEFLNFISLFVFVIALYLILMYPIKSLAIKLRKKDKVDLLSSNKKAYILLALVGVIILFSASTYSYLNYQKNVGIGENDIYYCNKIGKVEKLQYDDVKFYLVDDNEFEDETPYYYRRIVVVKDNDYENHVLSDYLGETDIDYAKLNEIGIEKTFDSLDDFCNEYNIENQYE